MNSISAPILNSLELESAPVHLNVPFGVVQILVIIGGGLATTRYRIGSVIASFSLVSLSGLVALSRALHSPSSSKQHVLTGYCVTAAAYGVGKLTSLVVIFAYQHYLVPLIYSWSSVNTAGSTKHKATSAFLFTGQSLGHVVGPILFTPSTGEILGRHGLWIAVVVHLCIVMLVVTTTAHLRNLNGDWTRRHSAKGKMSMNSKGRLERVLNIEETRNLSLSTTRDDDDGARYFFKKPVWEDLTDLEDEDFFFVL